MSFRNYAKLGVVTAILALASTACTAPVDEALETENTGEVSQAAKAPKIVLANVELIADPLGPVGGILPCVKVKRQLYLKNLVTDRKGLEFDVSYTSNGQQVEETVMVPMSDSEFMGQDPDSNKYFLLDSNIDLASPADPGSPVNVDVKLIKNINKYNSC